MKEKLYTILEKLNYYSDTFARLPFAKIDDIGKISVSLISSILNYRLALLLFGNDTTDELSLLSCKGIDKDIINAWNVDEAFFKHLQSNINRSIFLEFSKLEKSTVESANRLGLSDSCLVVPIDARVEEGIKRLGFLIAAEPDLDCEPDIDIMALEIIGGLVTGAITNYLATQDLVKANKGMEAEIIDRQAAEKRLDIERSQLLSIFDSLNEIVYVADPDTYEILFANKALENLFATKMVGELCYKVLQNRESPCNFCTNEIILKQKDKPYRWEFYNPLIKKHFMLVDRIIKWTDGRNVRFELGIDITQLKRAEEEKRELERQLQQAQKMEAIGALAGGIAHDFNNILGGIIGFAELAKYYVEKGSKAEKKIDQLLSATDRAKNLAKQILTFSHQDKIEKKPLLLKIVVKEIIKFLRASLPTTIEIRYNMSPDAGSIIGDPNQIHQVLLNLCTNAAYAMQEGGVLEINLENAEIDAEAASQYLEIEPGNYVKLSVSDTGHGMEKEVMERIFDPYFTTKEKGVGTGLGLSVVHGIVKSHGGIIKVHSELMKGTTFQLLFPLIDLEAAEESKSFESFPTGNECILSVDDDFIVLDANKEMLEVLGYNVIAKTSSTEALETFRAHPDKFDLVITDQTMPDMTGERLAKEIMRIRTDIPIIICTGFSESINEKKAKAVGIRALLMKPVVMRELAETVRDVLT